MGTKAWDCLQAGWKRSTSATLSLRRLRFFGGQCGRCLPSNSNSCKRLAMIMPTASSNLLTKRWSANPCQCALRLAVGDACMHIDRQGTLRCTLPDLLVTMHVAFGRILVTECFVDPKRLYRRS